jgi:hypothetical protein
VPDIFKALPLLLQFFFFQKQLELCQSFICDAVMVIALGIPIAGGVLVNTYSRTCRQKEGLSGRRRIDSLELYERTCAGDLLPVEYCCCGQLCTLDSWSHQLTTPAPGNNERPLYWRWRYLKQFRESNKKYIKKSRCNS